MSTTTVETRKKSGKNSVRLVFTTINLRRIIKYPLGPNAQFVTVGLSIDEDSNSSSPQPPWVLKFFQLSRRAKLTQIRKTP